MSTVTDLVEQPEAENELAVVQNAEPVKSAGDYRVESVAHALDAAYSRASLLQLNADEAKALEADFPDEAFRLGAGGDPELIYIEHAYLRRRLNQVLGVGASTPVKRRDWAETFRYWKVIDKRSNKGEYRDAVRIYAEIVLVVRGCFVSEAIGDAVYYPDNSKTNYSDAMESAKSNAFRRCCKEFGIGLQAWMKDWVEGWKQRNGNRPPSARPSNGAKHAPAPLPGPRLDADTDLAAWERHDAAGYIANCKTSAELLTFLNRMSGVDEWVANVADWRWLCKLIHTAFIGLFRLDNSQMNEELNSRLEEESAKLKELEGATSAT